MLDRIMRSLGYVPQVIVTDIHNHSVQLDTNLAAADLEITRLRKDAERAARHHNEIINTKNATIADLQEACKSLEKMLKASTRLVSVYVTDDKTLKETRLMLAGIDKEDNTVSVPVRKLVLSKKNRETLIGAAKMIAVSFGIAHTTVDFVSPKIGV